jgi:hypothetical protein
MTLAWLTPGEGLGAFMEQLSGGSVDFVRV